MTDKTNQTDLPGDLQPTFPATAEMLNDLTLDQDYDSGHTEEVSSRGYTGLRQVGSNPHLLSQDRISVDTFNKVNMSLFARRSSLLQSFRAQHTHRWKTEQDRRTSIPPFDADLHCAIVNELLDRTDNSGQRALGALLSDIGLGLGYRIRSLTFEDPKSDNNDEDVKVAGFTVAAAKDSGRPQTLIEVLQGVQKLPNSIVCEEYSAPEGYRWFCIIPGCKQKATHVDVGGFGQHLREKHGFTKNDTKEVFFDVANRKYRNLFGPYSVEEIQRQGKTRKMRAQKKNPRGGGGGQEPQDSATVKAKAKAAGRKGGSKAGSGRDLSPDSSSELSDPPDTDEE